MPKRKLDEVEGLTAFSPMQMKTHVRPKELADPRFMKEIYDRTLSLLRAGASKQFSGGDPTDVEMTASTLTPNPSRETSPPSRCLSPLPPVGTPGGTDTPMMCSSGENSPLKIAGEFAAQIQEHPMLNGTSTMGIQLCIDSQGKLVKRSTDQQAISSNSICRCGSENISSQCSFCEKLLCGRCHRLCADCHQAFCSVCSLVQYSSTGEETLCLTCQSNEMT